MQYYCLKKKRDVLISSQWLKAELFRFKQIIFWWKWRFQWKHSLKFDSHFKKTMVFTNYTITQWQINAMPLLVDGKWQLFSLAETALKSPQPISLQCRMRRTCLWYDSWHHYVHWWNELEHAKNIFKIIKIQLNWAVLTIWLVTKGQSFWCFFFNFAVTSQHFVEPLVLSVLNFSRLCSWVSKPLWINHHLCSAVACS